MAINFLNNVSVVETAASSDTDKFVVLDSGVLKYRTGAQVRSDIGAGTGSMSSWTIKEGNGTESTAVTNGETFTIAQGVGIQSEMTSISSGGTITITNTDRGSSQNIFKNFAVSGQSTVVADSNNDTITLATTGFLTITTNVATDTITLNNTLTNNNQLTNGANYITASSTNTLTNKSGNISQWTNDSGYITSASLPTVNNGTLTMTTSTGLDGSATFTANQSGTSTFAVTLNLTEITLGAGLDSTATGLSLDLSELADMTAAMTSTDEFIVLDSGAERRKAAGEIGLSIFNNNAGFITSASLPTVNNATITISPGTDITGGGSFTTNQGINGSITVNHADTSTLSGTYGSTSDGTKIDQITVDARGHVTAITTGATGSGNGTVTGSGTANYVSKWTSGTAQGNSTIYDNGSVGIGTTNPDGKLHIDGVSDTVSGLVLEASNSGDNRSIDFQNTAGALRLGIEYDNTNINLNVVDRNRDKLLTVRESGNVGIGTDNPDAKLEVSSSDASTYMHLNNDSTGNTRFKMSNDSDANANGFQIINNASDGQVNLLNYKNSDLALWTSSSQRMTIESGGNVGIGTPDPAAKLEVEGGDHLLQLSTTSSTGSPYLSFNQAGTRRSFIQHADGGDTLKIASEYGGIGFFTGTSGTETQKITIQSDGDVGIGTTSPSSKLHVRKAAGPLSSFNSNTIGIYETSGPGYVNIVTGATSTGELWFSDSSEGRGRVRYNHSDDSLQFWVANGEKLRVGVNGEIGIGGANYGSSGDVLTSNGSGSAPSWQAAGGGGNEFASGLYIGGTAAANLLEDYEKGTFTPTITSSVVTNGGLFPNPGTHYGYYERVGDFVTVSFELVFWGSSSAVTVDWTLTSLNNLPFTVRSTNGQGFYSDNPSFITYNGTAPNRLDFGGYGQRSTTKIIFVEAGSATQTFSISQYNVRTVAGTVTYRVI